MSWLNRLSHRRVTLRGRYGSGYFVRQFDLAEFSEVGGHRCGLDNVHGERLAGFVAELDAPNSGAVSMWFDERLRKVWQSVVKKQCGQCKHQVIRVRATYRG